MKRPINCLKYKQELEGLDSPPFPGADGEKIFELVSQQAWTEWLSLQTMLINEKELSLVEAPARQYLKDQMWKFFNNESVDLIEGYTPKPSD